MAEATLEAVPTEVRPVLSAYESTRQAVEKIKAVAPNSRVPDLVSWFPSPERQREIEAANQDVQAAFIAQALGHFVDWGDSTNLLGIHRVQDGGTAAGNLGLSQLAAAEAYYLVPSTNGQLDVYIDDLINSFLAGDLSKVAPKITTAGQAMGLHQKVLNRPGNTTGDLEDLYITFTDGSKSIDDPFDAVEYLDGAPRDAAIETASYDPQVNKLQLQFTAPA